MTLTPVALLLLTVQRHHLETQPDEHQVALAWREQILAARAAGELVVLVQWDGPAETPCETFGRGWVIHPDFAAQPGDLQLRAHEPDAFAGSALHSELASRGVQELRLLAVPDAPVIEPTLMTAQGLGYEVQIVSPSPAVPVSDHC